MDGIVYKILNLANGKFYIGSTQYPKARFREHVRDLNLGAHHNIHLQRAWNKYGEANFQFIVLEGGLGDNLLSREQFYLDSLSPNYNICKIAGSTFGIKFSDEVRKKFSLARKGMKRTLGYKHTPEARKNMSEARKLQYLLRPVSEETRQKLSEINMGKPKSEETKRKLAQAHLGLKASAETKKKMSISHMGKPPTRGSTGSKASPETKNRQSEARKRWWERKRQES